MAISSGVATIGTSTFRSKTEIANLVDRLLRFRIIRVPARPRKRPIMYNLARLSLPTAR